MRVAVCLSGLCHSWTEAYPSLKETIIDRYNADVFCSFWTSDYTGVFESTHREALAQIVNVKDCSIHDQIDLVTPFMEGYFRKSRMACFDKNFHTKTSEVVTAWGRRNVLNMFYLIKQCNDLKKRYELENNFKYDIVIRMRPDRAWELNSDLIKDKNTIYFHNLKGNLSDWAAYGPSDLMDIYSSVYTNIQSLAAYQEPRESDDRLVQGSSKAWRNWLNPHNTLSTHLDFAKELRPFNCVDLSREALRGNMVGEARRRAMHEQQMKQRGI